MTSILLKNATIVNEGHQFEGEILIEDGYISEISKGREIYRDAHQVIDCAGLIVMPGVIDDQVHFREPGLTHKATIYSESRAAVAGGTTTFMEMPNTKPPALTQELLEEKYQIAANSSPANYSFYMGVSNDNAYEVLKTDKKKVCGIKIFMGSSTGNMLVDNQSTLTTLFRESPMLIATHCEDEEIIKINSEQFKNKFGNNLSAADHPKIRTVEACYKSSSKAVDLAKEYNTRLHVFHISTAREISLFQNNIPLEQKRITSEVCVHHLSFNDTNYEELGNLIKCNPAIKSTADQLALWDALNSDLLDIVATDHAPHTWEEKLLDYLQAPSGLPLVQHSLLCMLDHVIAGKISLERMVYKMCHAPAICFKIEKRGFIKEGYWADLVLVNSSKNTTVSKDNIIYKCGWSPFMGRTFNSEIVGTIVSGNLIWYKGLFLNDIKGKRLEFEG